MQPLRRLFISPRNCSSYQLARSQPGSWRPACASFHWWEFWRSSPALPVAVFFLWAVFYSVCRDGGGSGCRDLGSHTRGGPPLSTVTAKDTPPASLADARTAQAGAKAYAAFGCANCHGAPVVKWQKFSEGLHPDPPDLKDVAGELSPAQLFRVIKNGINMTGMPSFEQAGAKDERDLVDRRLRQEAADVSEADYTSWAESSEPTACPVSAKQ